MSAVFRPRRVNCSCYFNLFVIRVLGMCLVWVFEDYLSIKGIILGRCSANQKRRYIVTPFLIDWAHNQNDPWIKIKF